MAKSHKKPVVIKSNDASDPVVEPEYVADLRTALSDALAEISLHTDLLHENAELEEKIKYLEVARDEVVEEQSEPDEVQAEKTLHNSTVSGAHKNVSDLKVVGNGDMFALLCKASSRAEGWMKSTKAMSFASGVVVQVTTQQRNPDGSYAVAEAVTYVPGVKVAEDSNGGRKLVGR